MRPISKKAIDRAKEAKPIRDALRKRVKACEVCRRPWDGRFLGEQDVHEILNGGLRLATLDKPETLLVVCRECHSTKLDDKKNYPPARQLAYLLASRPDQFDIESFNFLRNPNAPKFIELSEVIQWQERHSEAGL